MRLSVVLSTYNAPSLLERVLAGYARQTHRDFEVVVADDGSGPDTAELIEAWRDSSSQFSIAPKTTWAVRLTSLLSQKFFESR